MKYINLKKQILMTTIISVCICAFMLGLLWLFSACSTGPTESSTEGVQSAVNTTEIIDDYFIEVGRQGNHFFFYDKYTKVMYTQYYSFKSGSTSMTVMLNSGGKPLTYEEWYKYQEKKE